MKTLAEKKMQDIYRYLYFVKILQKNESYRKDFYEKELSAGYGWIVAIN